MRQTYVYNRYFDCLVRSDAKAAHERLAENLEKMLSNWFFKDAFDMISAIEFESMMRVGVAASTGLPQ
jgi:hypothetical protein